MELASTVEKMLDESHDLVNLKFLARSSHEREISGRGESTSRLIGGPVPGVCGGLSNYA
jgi:hypothetical protein